MQQLMHSLPKDAVFSLYHCREYTSSNSTEEQRFQVLPRAQPLPQRAPTCNSTAQARWDSRQGAGNSCSACPSHLLHIEGSTSRHTATPAHLVLAAFAPSAKDSPVAPHIHSLTTPSKIESGFSIFRREKLMPPKGCKGHHLCRETAKKSETFHLD